MDVDPKILRLIPPDTSTTTTIIQMIKRPFIPPSESNEMTEPNQADIMSALAAGSFRSKPASNSSLYSEITDPSALTQEAEGSKTKTNARKIYCFREGCGSVILQKGAATYLESSSTIVRPSASNPMTSRLISVAK
jgi:hypothetical protein